VLVLLGLIALPVVALAPELGSLRSASPETPQVYAKQNAPPDQQSAPEADEPHEEKSLWIPTTPAELFTLSIAVLTGVLAISTIGLWVVTMLGVRNQSRDTRILQRAYLWCELGYIRSLKDAPGFVPRIVIRNAGHLPAKHVAWVFGEPHITTDYDWRPTTDPPAPEGDITLAPGADMTHGSAALDIPANLAPGTYLYVWGYVRYNDGFEDGRISQFCHRYNLDLVRRRLETGGLRVIPKMAGRYNRYYNDTTRGAHMARALT
jgi:hypothetical protein